MFAEYAALARKKRRKIPKVSGELADCHFTIWFKVKSTLIRYRHTNWNYIVCSVCQIRIGSPSHRIRSRSRIFAEDYLKRKWNFGAVWNASINFPFVPTPFIFYNQTNNTNLICRIKFRRFYRLRYCHWWCAPDSITLLPYFLCLCVPFAQWFGRYEFRDARTINVSENTFRLFVRTAGAALVSRARTTSIV